MAHSNFIVYVDESGDHSLTSIDPTYPIFVLALCIFRKDEYAERVVPEVTRFKFDQFGHDQVILHERDIRKANGPFAFLVNRERRDAFHAELGRIMEEAPYKLIAGVIKKTALADTYIYPESPYDLALTFCLERLQMELRGTDTTYVVVERRGEKEDRDLELTFRRVCDGQNMLRERLPFEVTFVDKRANCSGLQFSDLIARPIGIHTLRPDQPNRAWEVFERKLRKGRWGQIEGYGLKVFP